jgi:hypothetical protein
MTSGEKARVLDEGDGGFVNVNGMPDESYRGSVSSLAMYAGLREDDEEGGDRCENDGVMAGAEVDAEEVDVSPCDELEEPCRKTEGRV